MSANGPNRFQAASEICSPRTRIDSDGLLIKRLNVRKEGICAYQTQNRAAFLNRLSMSRGWAGSVPSDVSET